MEAKKIVPLLLIIAIVIAIPVINKIVGRSAEQIVDAAHLSERVIRPSILASGNLTHEDEVRLSSEVIGKVSYLLVEEGDEVEANQVVLEIDDHNFVSAVEQSQAQVKLGKIDIERQQVRIDNLQRQWDRKNSLFLAQMVGEDEFEKLTNQLELARIDLLSSGEFLRQAQAQLEQASDRLSKTKVISPIAGVVTSLDIKVGETAIASSTNIPGSSLMTIANPASIYTEVQVDEADVASISIGQSAQIIAIANPESPMTGIVSFIANTAKVQPGRQGLSFVVKIRITDSAGVVLRPGMSCRAEIHTGSDEAVMAVPIQAILVNEDRASNKLEHHLFLHEDGVARRRTVTVGKSDDAYQQVVSGLMTTDEIITGPDSILRRLVDGDAIEIRRE